MHFVVKGFVGKHEMIVRWEDGELTGDEQVIDTLDRRAKLFEDDKIFPVAIATDLPRVAKHMADPMKLLALLIYDGLLPSILDRGEIVEMDLPQASAPNSSAS